VFLKNGGEAILEVSFRFKIKFKKTGASGQQNTVQIRKNVENLSVNLFRRLMMKVNYFFRKLTN
jgi:hypothetical protein